MESAAEAMLAGGKLVNAYQNEKVREHQVLANRLMVAVFVLSLFSHLPRSTWSRWLKVLFDAVEPGGLLVFTTHGVKAAAFDSVALDEEGFFFAPSSESNAIDAQEYGTTFTDEAFVRARVAELAGEPAQTYFSPQWFWNHQDAWVLQRAR